MNDDDDILDLLEQEKILLRMKARDFAFAKKLRLKPDRDIRSCLIKVQSKIKKSSSNQSSSDNDNRF